MKIVEVGFKLNNNYKFYKKILEHNGLKNDFNCTTRDIYFTNKSLDGMTENEMKNSCIRLRSVNENDYKIQNDLIGLNVDRISKLELNNFESNLNQKGYKKVFDTCKKDHHFYKTGMTTKVQIQEIDDIGILVYFDNKHYYELDSNEQRCKLIDELNSYGFNFNYSDLGLDKLRTLYYKKEMYSEDQNA